MQPNTVKYFTEIIFYKIFYGETNRPLGTVPKNWLDGSERIKLKLFIHEFMKPLDQVHRIYIFHSQNQILILISKFNLINFLFFII